jgi:hypothetical protein
MVTVPAPLLGRVTPEHELLLLCSRTRLAAEHAARAAALVSAGPDWEHLISCGGTHGVLPLVARALAVVPGIPAAVGEQLGEASRAAGRRSAWLTAELFRVLDLLAAAGVEALAFKGPVLGREGWGDAALRPFADLDLLVADEAIPQAAAALCASGLELAGVGPGRQRRAQLAHAWEVELTDKRGLVVDLHRSLVARHLARGPRTEDLLRRRRTVELDGRAVATLGRDDTLVALCLGATSELWSRMKYIVDVAELLKAPDAHDWPELLDRARHDGTLRMVLLGVVLAGDHAGLALPGPVGAALAREPGVAALHREAWQQLFARGDAAPPYLERNRFWLAARDGVGDRAASLWLRLWTPTVNDWRFVRLPDALYPLYYLVRPVRLVWHALTRWLPEALRGRPRQSAGL